jgi:type VI protein secretion system component Hcp
LDFYVVALEDVVVTHAGQCATTGAQSPLEFETLAKSPSGAAQLEEVTFHFGKIRWEYRALNAKGQVLPPNTGGWDVKANRTL